MIPVICEVLVKPRYHLHCRPLDTPLFIELKLKRGMELPDCLPKSPISSPMPGRFEGTILKYTCDYQSGKRGEEK